MKKTNDSTISRNERELTTLTFRVPQCTIDQLDNTAKLLGICKRDVLKRAVQNLAAETARSTELTFPAPPPGTTLGTSYKGDNDEQEFLAPRQPTTRAIQSHPSLRKH